jgi:hypothetical protein
MELLIEPAAQFGDQQRVIVPSRVIAAASQLEPAEQVAVQEALQHLGRAGIQPRPGLSVRKLETPDPLYVLYLNAAPDVLVLVRAPQQAPVEIVDLVRPETLQNLFHAGQDGAAADHTAAPLIKPSSVSTA